MVSKKKPYKNPGRTWTNPTLVDVLEEAKLHPIAHYMEVIWQTIFKFIVNQFFFISAGRGGEAVDGS